eukprot:14286913-Alexandrium_andersonii.AAC.1
MPPLTHAEFAALHNAQGRLQRWGPEYGNAGLMREWKWIGRDGIEEADRESWREEQTNPQLAEARRCFGSAGFTALGVLDLLPTTRADSLPFPLKAL